MTNGKDITVAVCTRDRAALFEQCVLRSLAAIADQGLPVVVVDQSRDDHTERLVRTISGARYLRSAPGLSAGRNVAVAAVRTALVAFTDDDVSFSVDWPASVVTVFDTDPMVGVVCGRALDPEGVPAPGAAAGNYHWPLNPFGLGSGFNMSFRVAALRDAGRFDEGLGAGARIPAGEDTDMLYRIAKAGWTVACVDGIEVVHHDWRAAADLGRLHYGYGLGAGAQTAKHLRARDRVAGRMGAREAARHVRTIAQAARGRNGDQIRRQLAFLAGMAVGFTKTVSAGRGPRSAARSERPRGE